MEWIASTLTPPPNVIYPALLKLMRTPRLPAVDGTDAPTDLNGLVRFWGRRNMVSALVPSRSARAIPPKATQQLWCRNIFLCYKLLNTKYFSNAFSISFNLFTRSDVYLRYTDWFIKISIKAEYIDNGTNIKKELFLHMISLILKIRLAHNT